ncbi:hypothetical protein [Flavobacterium litorale]|uniref:Uncharacterized protein n=1 Tax=Flavobacterium litorale TaxID=2856519 RepID=A0ABX8V5M0_9FLAO|nr:hypothetical protein [Flavobacterium litorale]QYJ68105.1 hypothetical protein K1I41_11330 [Flavobacterium litorale]
MYRLLILLLLIFIDSNAQHSITKDSLLIPVKKDLSETEFKKAVEAYVEMTKSETYIQYKKGLRIISTNLRLLDEVERKAYIDIDQSDKSQLEKWLKDNIKSTKFNSVNEGIDIIYGTFKLFKKLYWENEELYTSMRRANREQLRVIIAPERRTVYDVMDDSLKLEE